ncbi:Holliday junction resolvase RuvX [Ectothiorhodospiraceae bacterium WFHF3C12]|nr:Holliday junction resolvase RuvX [Ectothiorhodospiraceae bacterium WFHF3C12]
MRRIGVAVGETLTGSARPLTTLGCRNGAPDWSVVADLIREWRPVRLVVGLPRRLDGEESDLTRAARRFANRLSGRFDLPVSTAEEQLSSVEAERILAERGAGRRRDKGEVDRLAAAIILESYFSERAHHD